MNQEIEFPIGSILLSGDIGSGKSTILLAIDFALFGLQRGSLDGNSLLRNGTNKGSVELTFDIDGKEVIIKRSLKRVKDSSGQDQGYLIYNGKKEDLSPVELKQRVLELFNYPQELVTKSKSLIFRFTVYTPQEEMKHILLEDKDSRLDTLRKVFGVDKYKRLIENSNLFVNAIKVKKKEFSMLLSSYAEFNEEKEKLGEDNKSIERITEKLKLDLKHFVDFRERLIMELNSVEDNNKKLNELKTKLRVNESGLNLNMNNLNNAKNDMVDLKKKIDNLEKDVYDYYIEKDTDEKINLKENEIKNFESELNELNFKLNEAVIKKKSFDEINKSINSLDICPLCKQKVSEDHKHTIIDEEKKKINQFLDNIPIIDIRINLINKEREKLRKEIDELKEIKSKYEYHLLKKRDLEDKRERFDKLRNDDIKINNEINNLKKDIELLNMEISQFKDIEIEYSRLKREIEDIREKEKIIEIDIKSRENKIKDNNERLSILKKNIERLEIIKNNLTKLNEIQYWIDENLINLFNTMERHIMLRVHNDFSNLFDRWFNILIDDENLNVKLDDEFTPLIEQNGYNIDYNFLSGGEKTAAALAYRLSLNQVINNLISAIKTKDLLILDEPTDGFSEDQLDRIRILLEEINVKQIIIVSHESKIESFVENVIRFNKRDHVSEII
ncbi:MAG TPA: AAA family ATPase [Candidatus Nanoarchaeia archaeon]|nr:AAA family ATPase [Candidatus Nanoarchaeia archaeon]